MWLFLSMALANASDCKVYRGDYASYSNLVATVKGDKIYKGDYASYSNLMGTGKGCSMVDHIDEDKTNCNASNLRWVTRSENNNKSFKRGGYRP